MDIVISILAGAVFIVVSSLFYQLCTIERRVVNSRLEKFAKQDGENKKRLNISWKQLLEMASRLFARREIAKKFEKDLLRAGIPLKGEEFITLSLFIGAGTGVVTFLVSMNIFSGFLLALCGYLFPRFILNFRIKKRIKRIENQLGDTLATMANSMRAGFSFLQAMEMVGKEMPDPIAGEFKKTLREISLGTPTQKALNSLAERVGSEDLNLVVTAILIQRQVGGNLAEVLDNISETIRERLRINGEIKALTAQGRITGVIIGILPAILGLLIFLINPDYIVTLFRHRIGIMMLTAGVVSQLVGFVIIKKIVKIEV